jgi:hypothetical protein
MSMTKGMRATVIVGMVLTLGRAGMKTQAGLAPVNLRCEQRIDPLGIGDLNLHLSGQLQSARRRGETQSSYQIQVGATPSGSQYFNRIRTN